jgi:N-acetylmuramoyl-L-alanine amidase
MPDYIYKVFDPAVDKIYAAHLTGATIKAIGQAEKADVAVNFNYADDDAGIPIGRLIVGGKIVINDIAKTVPRHELYALPDGALHIGKAPANAVWAVQGSPRLLDNGLNVVDASVKRDKTGSDIYTRSAIRTAVGLTVSRKLVIVRTYKAYTLDELAAIMKKLGCTDAINGDGGGSSYVWPVDSGYGRKLGSALIVKKGANKPMAMTKPFILIDPGHGGTDPGAGDNGIVEKEYTLKISLYQIERFKELGVPAALTRDVDKSLDSEQRTKIVRDSGAKICISNHINAAASKDAQGAEAIHSIHNDGKLAHALVYALRDAGQILRKTPVFTKQRADGSDYYFMHHDTGTIATTIIEYGFLTNEADAAKIKAKWQTYAEAVVRAVCSFGGYNYKPKEVPPVTTPAEPKPSIDYIGHWAENDIKAVMDKGIMNGVGNGNFAPDKPVTRAEMAVIVNRLLKRLEG